MKDEIMSKADVRAFTLIFLGLAGYSIFMFYLLAKRSKGINYFDDLYSVNNFLVYFLIFLQFVLLRQAKIYVTKNKIRLVNFLWGIGAFIGGVLLASGFFTIVL
ncbi:hypothetical protein [Acinetobacter pittii]|uniref:hypothetical protein n=1 Tax=Acinetobacter pittii TaxID=48296 RepID=UPI001F1D518C|nr:hypothetical protein [Acinetobacter pittii]MCE6237415.1 hypothetical protein [Acinetobacter pittii]MCE6692408.1 hypothetical protein [Acinetobacter pittii]MCE6699694.1 hypothetical protein [Acinetobacter pittii]MCU4527214.1 hypothetical protein [Acinetobacter pittii]